MPSYPPKVIIDFYSTSNLLFCLKPKETACTKLGGALPEEISGYVSRNTAANESKKSETDKMLVDSKGPHLELLGVEKQQSSNGTGDGAWANNN